MRSFFPVYSFLRATRFYHDTLLFFFFNIRELSFPMKKLRLIKLYPFNSSQFSARWPIEFVLEFVWRLVDKADARDSRSETMGSGSMMRRGENDLHRKGAAPRRRRPRCVRSRRAPLGPIEPPRPRRIIESLVKPPVPYSYSYIPSLSISFLLLFFHRSLYFFFYSIPSTNSLAATLSRTYSSYFTITISGSSRFSRPRRTLSLYICIFGPLLNIPTLRGLHTRTFDHHVDRSNRSCGS